MNLHKRINENINNIIYYFIVYYWRQGRISTGIFERFVDTQTDVKCKKSLEKLRLMLRLA